MRNKYDRYVSIFVFRHLNQGDYNYQMSKD